MNLRQALELAAAKLPETNSTIVEIQAELQALEADARRYRVIRKALAAQDQRMADLIDHADMDLGDRDTITEGEIDTIADRIVAVCAG